MESEARSMFHPSPGEIHYIWWYIQGSIMNPEVRRTLRRARGYVREACLACPFN